VSKEVEEWERAVWSAWVEETTRSDGSPDDKAVSKVFVPGQTIPGVESRADVNYFIQHPVLNQNGGNNDGDNLY